MLTGFAHDLVIPVFRLNRSHALFGVLAFFQLLLEPIEHLNGFCPVRRMPINVYHPELKIGLYGIEALLIEFPPRTSPDRPSEEIGLTIA
jgi:hypothetical protein